MRKQPHMTRGRSRFSIGSSGGSLHAKTFAVDRSRVFVGSFNFDPRSAELNTEMGFVIESTRMAESLAAIFDEEIPLGAYQLRLSKSNGMEWLERGSSGTVEHRSEPGATLWKRFGLSVLSALPIEPLL